MKRYFGFFSGKLKIGDRWETDKERALRLMKIPAKMKLEWLYEMNEFINKFSPKKATRIRQRLKRA